MKSIISILLLSICLCPLPGYAQTGDNEEVLFFEEYEELVVVTASKRDQAISEAPAIVSIITREDIRNLGIQTLPDLMRYVPGFVVEDVYWRGPIVTSRGVAMTLYNDKILMLIDGVPAYETVTLEYYLDIIPVDAIRKIEIIRGPGSTLYGTNAFSAVINIITKDGDSQKGVDTSVKFGSFNTRAINFAYGDYYHSRNLDVFVAGSFTDNDGYDHILPQDEAGIKNINLNYENDIQNVFAKFRYKGLTFTTGYYFQNVAKFSMTTAIAYGSDQAPGGGRAEHTKYYVNGGYTFSLSDKIDGELALHHDYMDKETGVGKFGTVNFAHSVLGDTTYPVNLVEVDPSFAAPNYSLYKGRLYNGEARLTYHFNERHRLLGGFTGEIRDCDDVYTMLGERDGRVIPTHEGSTQTPPDNVTDVAGYLQFDGKFINKLGYIAGVRLSYLGISEKSYLTPRGGLVYHFSKNMSAKLLYGEAFRGPGFQEQFFLVHAVTYGADAAGRKLEPERITTIETAVDILLANKYSLRLNGFVIDTKDLILRRPVAGSADTLALGHNRGYIYDNFGQQRITGAELETKCYVNQYFNFFANLSLRNGKNQEKGPTDVSDELPFFIETTANAGFVVKPSELGQLSFNVQYVGSQERLVANGDPVKVDGYTTLNGVIQINFNHYLRLSITGLNLLNEEYWYPERVRLRIPKLPGGPERSIYVALHCWMNS